MKREFDRYVVVKNSHAHEALTPGEHRELYRLGMKVARWRQDNGKAPFECVVVEHDWPEYETVWQMIEDRVDGFDANADQPLKGLNQLSSLARMGIAHRAFGNPIPHPIYDVIRRTEHAMVEFNQSIIHKAEMFDKLRNLLGYIENGTSESIHITQDDTTMHWCLACRNTGYSVMGGVQDKWWEVAPSLEQVIKVAYEKHGGD